MKEYLEPIVTIGIPFYNEEKYIGDTIRSVISQSYNGIKILLADNHSNDNSFSIAKEYASKDSRIEVFRHDKNNGSTYNFEFVRDLASSKYFIWLGGHDIISHSYIEEAVKVLEDDEKIAMVYPGAVEIDAGGNQIGAILDDYDTVNLTTEEAILKIAQNFMNGYVIHGVFRTEILLKLPIKRIIASDMLIVLLSNFYGRIHRLSLTGFHRRTVIIDEMSHEQEKRHEEYGIYKRSKSNPFSFLLIEAWKQIVMKKGISFFHKFSLILKLKTVFTERFGVRWGTLIKSLVYARLKL